MVTVSLGLVTSRHLLAWFGGIGTALDYFLVKYGRKWVWGRGLLSEHFAPGNLCEVTFAAWREALQGNAFFKVLIHRMQCIVLFPDTIRS